MGSFLIGYMEVRYSLLYYVLLVVPNKLWALLKRFVTVLKRILSCNWYNFNGFYKFWMHSWKINELQCLVGTSRSILVNFVKIKQVLLMATLFNISLESKNYRIRGLFGGDFNLGVWRIFIWSPNLNHTILSRTHEMN